MSVRIERLSIKNFGPLRDLTLTPGDVTVVFGRNEAGKTSCIDALTRALRERVRAGNRKLLEGMREGPGFEGTIDLELKPEDGGALIQLLREHPSLARLFIVRDGDAQLEGGRNWLNAIRGKLIGIDLAKVSDRVRRASALTPTGALREAKQDEKTRLDERLLRVEGYLAGLPQIGALIEEIQNLDAARAQHRRDAEALRAAERFQRYKLGLETRQTVTDAHETLIGLEQYSDSDLKDWRDAVSSVRESAAVTKTAESEVHRLRSDIDLAREELRKKEIAAAGAADRADELERKSIPQQVEEARAARRSAETWTVWRTPCSVGGVLLLLAAIGIGTQALAPGDPQRVLAFGLAAGATAFGGLVASALGILGTGRLRRARTLEEEAIGEAGVVLVPTQTLEECHAQVTRALRAVEQSRIARSGAEDRLRNIEQSLESAERTERERSGGLDEAQRRVADVRERVRLAGIDQLEDKLHRRTQCQSTLDEARRTLARLLGSDPEAADALSLARRVDELEVPDPEVEPNPARLATLERDIEQADAALVSLRAKLADRRDRALAAIGIDDLGAAEAERDRLRESITGIDRRANAARLCLRALTELAQDIDRPLREALGGGHGAAGHYLSQLTSGAYRSVVLDGDGRLAVERKDGTRFGSDALSRGARDQLSLAVRLSLVRRLLGEPGFMVLDDAFISSDPGRKEALAGALADLAKEGWQILYFTFDPVLRDRLGQLQATVVNLSR